MARIEAALLDLDSTCIRTEETFAKVHDQARLELALELGVPLTEIEAKVSLHMNNAKRVCSVEPTGLIALTVMGLKRSYLGVGSEIWERFSDKLWEVYTTPVELFDDTLDVMEGLKSMDIEIGIVTQGKKTWTEGKDKMLRPYLVNGRSFCVRTDLPKSTYSWQGGRFL